MHQAARIGIVTVAFLSQVACFEMDTKVTLAADGTGSVSSQMTFQQAFLDLMGEMGGDKAKAEKEMEEKVPTVDAATQEKLAAAGLTFTNAELKKTDAGLGWSTNVGFKNLSSLSAIIDDEAAAKEIPTPKVWINDLGAGRYELHMDPPDTKTDDAMPSMGGGDDDAGSKKKKSKKDAGKDLQKAMDAMAKMMEMVSDLRVAFSIDVPGTIEEIRPTELGHYEGHTATWTIDGSTISAAMATGGAGMPNEDMVVIFAMPAGQMLPADALGTAPPPAPEATP